MANIRITFRAAASHFASLFETFSYDARAVLRFHPSRARSPAARFARAGCHGRIRSTTVRSHLRALSERSLRSATARSNSGNVRGEIASWIAPRDQMEVWCRRAIVLDPGYYGAYERKMTYLEPKWHGSAEELLAFGHECLAGRNWAGSVPFFHSAAGEDAGISRQGGGEAAGAVVS